MPTKRTPLQRGLKPQITAEALRLWRLCRSIQDQRGAVDRFEDDRPSGRRREYLDATKALARALGGSWLDWSPLDATTETPPVYIARNDAQAPDYARAWQLRQALIAAAGE